MKNKFVLETNAKYTTDQSDLLVWINKIYYYDPTNECYKAKITLANKHNGIVYEVATKYDLNRNMISHWQKVE